MRKNNNSKRNIKSLPKSKQNKGAGNSGEVIKIDDSIFSGSVTVEELECIQYPRADADSIRFPKPEDAPTVITFERKMPNEDLRQAKRRSKK